jgi:hypothetical protein
MSSEATGSSEAAAAAAVGVPPPAEPVPEPASAPAPTPTPGSTPPLASHPRPDASGWQPGIPPSIREHLPSIVFGAGLPICVYFAVRSHVHTDAQALIVAGCFSVAWILIQAVRQRRVDFLALSILLGFAVGVASSILLGGNAYVLKVRDAFFTALFGVVCIVTLFTHDRPAFFYVSRYFSAGTDPERVSAFDRLHEVPIGRHTFRVLSVVWGVGLVLEASLRMALAKMLPTGTFLAVSPFVTVSMIGGLFLFTVLYSKRAQEAAMVWAASGTSASSPPSASSGTPSSGTAGAARPPIQADATGDGFPQIPLP